MSPDRETKPSFEVDALNYTGIQYSAKGFLAHARLPYRMIQVCICKNTVGHRPRIATSHAYRTR